jgi:hypothetical protein
MGIAVGLNYDTILDATEVREKSKDWILPPESCTAYIWPTQPFPQQLFCRREIFGHLARALASDSFEQSALIPAAHAAPPP